MRNLFHIYYFWMENYIIQFALYRRRVLLRPKNAMSPTIIPLLYYKSPFHMSWILFIETEIILKGHVTILIPTGVSFLNSFLAHMNAGLTQYWNKCILIFRVVYFISCRCVLILESSWFQLDLIQMPPELLNTHVFFLLFLLRSSLLSELMNVVFIKLIAYLPWRLDLSMLFWSAGVNWDLITDI